MLIENNIFRGLLFAVVGGVSLLFVFFYRHRVGKHRLRCSEETTAIVTNRRRRGTKGGSVYQPTYAYYALGAQRQVTSRSAYRPPVAGDGEEVALFYNLQDPQDIYVPKEGGQNLFFIGFIGVLGVLFMVLGTAVATGFLA